MYPHTTEILNIMHHDNYGTMYKEFVKPQDKWKWPKNAADIEVQAAKLSEEEKETMAAGEHTEMLAVVKKHKCKMLHEFLNDVFDGELSSNFLKEH